MIISTQRINIRLIISSIWTFLIQFDMAKMDKNSKIWSLLEYTISNSVQGLRLDPTKDSRPYIVSPGSQEKQFSLTGQ